MARSREMRFSHGRQFPASFFRPIDIARGDLCQRMVDLLIKCAPFFFGPGLLGFQDLQSPPEDLLGAAVFAARKPLYQLGVEGQAECSAA